MSRIRTSAFMCDYSHKLIVPSFNPSSKFCSEIFKVPGLSRIVDEFLLMNMSLHVPSHIQTLLQFLRAERIQVQFLLKAYTPQYLGLHGLGACGRRGLFPNKPHQLHNGIVRQPVDLLRFGIHRVPAQCFRELLQRSFKSCLQSLSQNVDRISLVIDDAREFFRVLQCETGGFLRIFLALQGGLVLEGEEFFYKSSAFDYQMWGDGFEYIAQTLLCVLLFGVSLAVCFCEEGEGGAQGVDEEEGGEGGTSGLQALDEAVQVLRELLGEVIGVGGVEGGQGTPQLRTVLFM